MALRQEGRSVAVVPEATELGTEAKRGLRAGVQAERLSRALVLAFRLRQQRGEVLAGMGRQVARERSGPKEGSQGMPENGTRRFQLPKSAKVGEDMGTEESRSIAVPNYFRFL